MGRRRALGWYFVLAFGIAWTGALLTGSPRSTPAMFTAMLLGPSVASLGLTAALHGRRGLRALGQRLWRWRVGGRWYAAVLVAPVLLLAVLSGASAFSRDLVPALLSGSSPASTVVVIALVAGLGAGFFEELGWTGFATPRLLRRHSWFVSGLLLGAPWAVWHLLPDFLGSAEHGRWWVVHAVEWLVSLTAFRAFMTWVYGHTRSLFLAVLLHAVSTGAQLLAWPSPGPLRSEAGWYGAFALGWVLVVAGVLVATRASRATPPRPWSAHTRRGAMPVS